MTPESSHYKKVPIGKILKKLMGEFVERPDSGVTEGNLDMKEKEIEAALVRAVKDRGGLAPKLVSPGFDGMPDRLVLLPDGKSAFVELKAPGKKPRAIQVRRIRDLVGLGYGVFVVDYKEMIEEVLDAIQTT